jgi:hypothetical protein
MRTRLRLCADTPAPAHQPTPPTRPQPYTIPVYRKEPCSHEQPRALSYGVLAAGVDSSTVDDAAAEVQERLQAAGLYTVTSSNISNGLHQVLESIWPR